MGKKEKKIVFVPIVARRSSISPWELKNLNSAKSSPDNTNVIWLVCMTNIPLSLSSFLILFIIFYLFGLLFIFIIIIIITI